MFLLRATLIVLFLAQTFQTVSANDAEKFFETRIRPLLAKRCFECHGEKKQESDVRLDHKSLVMAKGAGTPLIAPGNVEDSRLWQVVKYDESDVQMPPEAPLPEEEKELLKQWIREGAYWPDEAAPPVKGLSGIPKNPDGTINFVEAVQQHWAYQPVRNVPVPVPTQPEKCRLPIDHFIERDLVAAGLHFSEPASRATLIRRLKLDLHGIPPTFAEVQEFENDKDPKAIENLVDRLLASPEYGQRWGRYWLDVARYADTKGYVFTENRFYPYAYTYRDYVVRAFNDDLPYHEFIRQQLAVDQLGFPENDYRLAALGFLTVGPRFLNREPDIIDDRIDVVTRGLMGMTVACARCHDHKYDPIPTTDYYSLYGVFQSSREPEELPLIGTVDEADPKYQAFVTERKKRETELSDFISKSHNDLLNQAVDRLEDLIPAAAKLMKLVGPDVDLQPKHGNPRVKLVEHWKGYIEKRITASDPAFIPWKTLMAASDETLAQPENGVLKSVVDEPATPAIIRDAIVKTPPRSRLEVARLYGTLLQEVREEWKQVAQQTPPGERLPDAQREALRQKLYGPEGIQDVPVQERSPVFERDQFDKIRQLKAKIAGWDATSPDAPARAMVMVDKEKPVKPAVFVRGDPNRRGEQIDRHAPRILDPEAVKPFKSGSGRLELAEKIVSPDNPLTARVLVNRVWARHFGVPIVATTSDFGTRAEMPSHPELLDYLAWTFMHEDNWSIKSLHRRILLSTTYLQASADNEQARQIDPENSLLWRQNRQRMDFESMRDSQLQVSHMLTTALGGRPFDLEKETSSPRRTIYAQIDRNNLLGLLRTFDFPSPDSSSPGRPLTSVPQQALFAMNAPFTITVSKQLAEEVRKQSSEPDGQAKLLIETVYSRSAQPHEIEMLTKYLEKHPLEQLSQALLMTSEFLFVD